MWNQLSCFVNTEKMMNLKVSAQIKSQSEYMLPDLSQIGPCKKFLPFFKNHLSIGNTIRLQRLSLICLRWVSNVFRTGHIVQFEYLSKLFGPGLYAATSISHIVTGLQNTVYWKSYILYMHKNCLYKWKMKGIQNDYDRMRDLNTDTLTLTGLRLIENVVLFQYIIIHIVSGRNIWTGTKINMS